MVGLGETDFPLETLEGKAARLLGAQGHAAESGSRRVGKVTPEAGGGGPAGRCCAVDAAQGQAC